MHCRLPSATSKTKISRIGQNHKKPGVLTQMPATPQVSGNRDDDCAVEHSMPWRKEEIFVSEDQNMAREGENSRVTFSHQVAN